MMCGVPGRLLVSGVLFLTWFPTFGLSPKAQAGDYNIAVHVSGSSYSPVNALFQILTAVIGGRNYELYGGTSSAKAYMHGNGLLDPGDYHARPKVDIHKTSFESIQSFELLLPDGSKRVFEVIGQSE